jgi:hypothetical protein
VPSRTLKEVDIMPARTRLIRRGPNTTRAHRVRPAVELLEDRTVPTLLGQQLFPSDNPWNQNIANAPVAANSTAIINNIVSNNGGVDGQLHPDFGQDYHDSSDLYGIPYNVVHGNSTPKVQVVIDAYASESDIESAPIPTNAVLEGDLQNAPVAGVDNRGDSHLLVYDVDNNIGYEFYRASRPSENTDGQWHADQETVWNYSTNTFRTLGYTSADAAGLPILPGLVRPDEALPVSQGGQGAIDHAIRFTLQNNDILNQFLYPASHTANAGNNNPAVEPPMGTRFRLKASVDISTLNPESQIIARAMQDYGLILADNGSDFFFSGASSSVNASNGLTLTWNDNDIQDTVHGLKSLNYSDFEVVSLTPVVTGLSATGGAAGDTITVTGENFSGAAGHLQVLFGSTPATSVHVVNDSHVTAVVPIGTGTVDVRVQSGVNEPNTSNVNNPIFGYGTSGVTAADRFTYGGNTTNQPPTVAHAAAASSNPVTGTRTGLSVLGADDGGEASLTYTWTVVSAPAGASAVFSVNGSNTAKNTTVTFNRAGTYIFQATITDAGGLSVTSRVTVTVRQTLSKITLTPGSATVADRGTVQLKATALDQFGQALLNQPAFSWSVVSGPGTVSGGKYTAPATGSGTAVVQVTAGGKSARATIKVTAATSTKAAPSLWTKLLGLSDPATDGTL